MDAVSFLLDGMTLGLIVWGAYLCAAKTDRRIGGERRASARGGRRTGDIRAVGPGAGPKPAHDKGGVADWKKRRAA